MQDSKESPKSETAPVVEKKEALYETPKKSGKKPIVIIAIILGALLVLCIICAVIISLFSKNAVDTLNNLITPTVTSYPSDTTTPNDTSDIVVPTQSTNAGLGEWVSVKNFNWKVVSATNLGDTLKSTNQYIESKKTSGNWIQVKFEALNTGTDAAYIIVPQIVDANGVEFDYSSDGFFFIPSDESPVLEKLNPGISGSYTAIYEVSSPISGLKLLVGEGMFNSGKLVDLGL